MHTTNSVTSLLMDAGRSTYFTSIYEPNLKRTKLFGEKLSDSLERTLKRHKESLDCSDKERDLINTNSNEPEQSSKDSYKDAKLKLYSPLISSKVASTVYINSNQRLKSISNTVQDHKISSLSNVEKLTGVFDANSSSSSSNRFNSNRNQRLAKPIVFGATITGYPLPIDGLSQVSKRSKKSNSPQSLKNNFKSFPPMMASSGATSNQTKTATTSSSTKTLVINHACHSNADESYNSSISNNQKVITTSSNLSSQLMLSSIISTTQAKSNPNSSFSPLTSPSATNYSSDQNKFRLQSTSSSNNTTTISTTNTTTITNTTNNTSTTKQKAQQRQQQQKIKTEQPSTICLEDTASLSTKPFSPVELTSKCSSSSNNKSQTWTNKPPNHSSAPLNGNGRSATQQTSAQPNNHAVAARLIDMGKRLLDAAREGQVDHVRQLVVNSGAPFTSDWLGTTALHLAAQYGHAEIAEILLRGGVNRDARTKLERTALHLAAQGGSLEVVNLLLVHGSDINARDMLKMTPLHWAVERGHFCVVEKLLFSGADISVKSKFQLTPIEIAHSTERCDIVDLFKTWASNKHEIDLDLELDYQSDTTTGTSRFGESKNVFDVDYNHLTVEDNDAPIATTKTTNGRASLLDIVDEPCIDLVELEWSSLKFEPDFFMSNDDENEPKVEYLMKVVEELQKENKQLRKRVEQLSM